MQKIIPVIIAVLGLIPLVDNGKLAGDNQGCCNDRLMAMATCSGSFPCNACSDCSRCAYCKSGGKCGVCAPAMTLPKPRISSSPVVPTVVREEPGRTVPKAPAMTTPLTMEEWIEERGVGVRSVDPPKTLDPRLVVDVEYPLKVGDDVSLFGTFGGTPIPQPVATLRDFYYQILHAAFDRKAAYWAELNDRGWIRYYPSGTAVKILSFDDYPYPRGDVSSLNRALHLRIMEGRHRGDDVVAPAFTVVRLATREAIDERISRAMGKKADTVLKMAQGLEKAKKPQAAINYYRQVVDGFPGTSQADEAAKRIDVLSTRGVTQGVEK